MLVFFSLVNSTDDAGIFSAAADLHIARCDYDDMADDIGLLEDAKVSIGPAELTSSLDWKELSVSSFSSSSSAAAAALITSQPAAGRLSPLSPCDNPLITRAHHHSLAPPLISLPPSLTGSSTQQQQQPRSAGELPGKNTFSHSQDLCVKKRIFQRHL